MEHFGLPTCDCHMKQGQCCDTCQIWLPAIARHEKEIDNLLTLLSCHTRHWHVIGEAFGLCMGGVDGDVTDLHGNAAVIITHCIEIAQRTQRETATACRDIAAESFRSDDSATTVAGAIAFRIKERFGLEI